MQALRSLSDSHFSCPGSQFAYTEARYTAAGIGCCLTCPSDLDRSPGVYRGHARCRADASAGCALLTNFILVTSLQRPKSQHPRNATAHTSARTQQTYDDGRATYTHTSATGGGIPAASFNH